MDTAKSQPSGQIILLNGASSSGKSSIALALQSHLPAPFLHISIDHFRDSGVLPLERIRSGEFSWAEMRANFFIGFERALVGLASAGNNLIVEYIIEKEDWMHRLRALWDDFDVFLVGVHCPLEELEKRERQRGDRPLGDARRDYFSVHQYCQYDFEVDSTLSPQLNASSICRAHAARDFPKMSKPRSS